MPERGNQFGALARHTMAAIATHRRTNRRGAMIPRAARPGLASLALLLLAGCASAVPPTLPPNEPQPTPIAWPSFAPAPASTPSAGAGNVGDTGFPELSVEALGSDAVRATIVDPAAKAWRLVITGVGARAGDRLELLVETGDTGPSITATEIRDRAVVGSMDLSGYADGTAAAGGCHGTLGACVDSDGFRLPADGDGTFSVHLTLVEPTAALTITGGTATWPAEPFILGPWQDTRPFDWGDR
jgi:hypothetical protein